MRKKKIKILNQFHMYRIGEKTMEQLRNKDTRSMMDLVAKKVFNNSIR